MSLHVIEDPYDDNERKMVEIIEGIFRKAREDAEPYIKALSFSRACKMPRYIFTPDDIPPGSLDELKALCRTSSGA